MAAPPSLPLNQSPVPSLSDTARAQFVMVPRLLVCTMMCPAIAEALIGDRERLKYLHRGLYPQEVRVQVYVYHFHPRRNLNV